MNIDDKCVVSFHYTLTNGDGEKLDSSDGRDPLSYLHGAGNIVPGLENALNGKTAGDALKVVVEPAEGYGDFRPELVQKVPRTAFEGVDKIEAGMQFQAQGQDGQVQMITVQDVTEDEITVNANHPLAGQVLHFDVKVEAVRAATDEEIEHGHAH